MTLNLVMNVRSQAETLAMVLQIDLGQLRMSTVLRAFRTLVCGKVFSLTALFPRKLLRQLMIPPLRKSCFISDTALALAVVASEVVTLISK